MKGDKQKPMLNAGTKTPTAGMIGGTSNDTYGPQSAKKSGPTMSFSKGGKVISSSCK